MVYEGRKGIGAVALGLIAVSVGDAARLDKRPSGADGAQLVWLDHGPVACDGDQFIPAGTLDGYHTYRLYVRMEIEDAVNVVSTGARSRIDREVVAPLFFPEVRPFQHPAGSNTPPGETMSRAAAQVGICIDADSYFALGAPGATMYFVNEPSPGDWGEALDMVWLGVPKDFGAVDAEVFGDDARYVMIMQVILPPGTPITGGLRIGFGDWQLRTRPANADFDVPPLPAPGSSGRSALGASTPLPDATQDTFVTLDDVAEVLSAWGKCRRHCAADFNGDRKVNRRDLASVLRALGHEPDHTDKATWRNAMRELNSGALATIMHDRSASRARKHLKRLFKAYKG